MKLFLEGLLPRLVYKESAFYWSMVAAMIIWFLGGRNIAGRSIPGLFAVMLVSALVSMFLISEIHYRYDILIEYSLRKQRDEEGLILPRHYASDRLVYRELHSEDTKLIKALSGDALIRDYIDDIDSDMSKAEAKRWVSGHMRLERTSLRCTRIAVSKENNCPVGGIVIINGHELEYWLLDKYRHQGFAYEAVKASINQIEKEDNIVLFAKCSPKNAPSIGLLKKAGFKINDIARGKKSNTDEKRRSESPLYWVYDQRSR